MGASAESQQPQLEEGSAQTQNKAAEQLENTTKHENLRRMRQFVTKLVLIALRDAGCRGAMLHTSPEVVQNRSAALHRPSHLELIYFRVL